MHSLGSDRNALKILGQIQEFLHVQTHHGRNVYYLNKTGRELIGHTEELKWNTQVDHHLMRNDMYLHFECPEDWRVEEKVTYKWNDGMVSLVPDATFTKDKTIYFLEVDRTQSMMENKKKIESYCRLSPLVSRQFNHAPVLLFYTLSPVRQAKLKKLCQEVNLQASIYTKEDTH